jgi:hypothetical protein
MEERKQLRDRIVREKDRSERQFHHLTSNFYIMKSALRYFSEKTGNSFTASRVSEKFPVAVSVAGSSLNVLERLDVIQKRNDSTSADRYMPQEVDLELLEQVQEILIENREIEKFRSTS